MMRAALLLAALAMAASIPASAQLTTLQAGGALKTSGGGGPVCANGNLLLVYSDPCQLMSQMVGL